MNSPVSPTSMDDDLNFPANAAYVEARMSEAVREAPLDAMSERFMKSRLMPRVRDLERGAATNTVRPEAGEWEKFGPRIKMKVLRREADGRRGRPGPDGRRGQCRPGAVPGEAGRPEPVFGRPPGAGGVGTFSICT